MDTEKTHSGLLSRIQLMEQHAAKGTLPTGLKISRVQAKGHNVDVLQCLFDDIIRQAELKLLEAVIENLRSEVKPLEEAIAEREADIDGTIAMWKSGLLKSREITHSQVNALVEAAMTLVQTLSSDSATLRASKALQAEINRKENKQEVMDAGEDFIPSEDSIREIIRHEIQQSMKPPPEANRQRKVTLKGDKRKGRQRSRQNRSKQQQHGRSKSPQVNRRPRSSSKNARGRGSGHVR